MVKVKSLEVQDVRYPTSRTLDGSDAMNPAPDYSAAYVVLRTDDGAEGHAFAFTIGRGNDLQAAAIECFEDLVVGTPVAQLVEDTGEFARRLVHDSQLRWLGPEKGVIHMAVGAIVNAAWDLRSKLAGKPLWMLLADLDVDDLVDQIDFRHLSDVLGVEEARDLIQQRSAGTEERRRHLESQGLPAYTTTPGWLGYDDEKLVRLCREAVAEGFNFVKLKVGGSHEDDMRRCQLARDTLGPDIRLAIDANQVWEVEEAIQKLHDLAAFDLTWIEEPTSPDDILGHRRIRQEGGVPVATGEHVQNRVIFKQLISAEAVDYVQIDATRVGGVNENLANILLAAKFHVPVCPHAGGVGLCEMVQHLSMFDYVRLGGDLESRWVEHVDHLHEHFVDPVRMRDGRYAAPTAPGFSTEMYVASRKRFEYPGGAAWEKHLLKTTLSETESIA